MASSPGCRLRAFLVSEDRSRLVFRHSDEEVLPSQSQARLWVGHGGLADDLAAAQAIQASARPACFGSHGRLLPGSSATAHTGSRASERRSFRAVAEAVAGPTPGTGAAGLRHGWQYPAARAHGRSGRDLSAGAPRRKRKLSYPRQIRSRGAHSPGVMNCLLPGSPAKSSLGGN